MKYKIDQLANHRLKFTFLTAIAIAPIISFGNTDQQKTVFIDANSFKTLDQLIEQIKKAAGDKQPKNIDKNDIYKIFAEAFVKYAKDAIDLGIKIPDEIIKMLPAGKKVMVPALVIFTLWGIKFIVPIAAFFEAILGSIAVMIIFIIAAIGESESKAKKT
jgi:ABC-type dipeptide/oligopeptide/nickel transport system permease component